MSASPPGGTPGRFGRFFLWLNGVYEEEAIPFHTVTEAAVAQDYTARAIATPRNTGSFEQELREAKQSDWPLVVKVAKGSGSLYPDKLWVGRSRNNDIVIRHSSVSKMHAYFVPHQDGLEICDSGSHNGTFVDGRRLDSGVVGSIRSGQAVRFGAVQGTFLDADGLRDLLARTRRK